MLGLGDYNVASIEARLEMRPHRRSITLQACSGLDCDIGLSNAPEYTCRQNHNTWRGMKGWQTSIPRPGRCVGCRVSTAPFLAKGAFERRNRMGKSLPSKQNPV